MRQRIACALLFAAAARAQAPAPPAEAPVLQNTGKPMVIEYSCTEEDIQAAGLNCTLDDPCPVYLELAAVEAVGNRVFVAGNIHSSSTTLYSVLLSSDDAGKTWHEPRERIRSAGLDGIQFVDFENGWISGAVLHPLPHDPFFLITSDGGQTWRYHPISTEPNYGSIQQFWFNSRSSGSMVIDRGRGSENGRYELYETSNAGESWSLKQGSDQPIRMKRAGTANADWRVRADAASKSFHVERHTGERWHSIAAFSVSIGSCKPPEAPPAPAEPGEATAPRKSPSEER